MDRDNIDAIAEALSEMFGELQSTIQQYAVLQLTQYSDNPTEWKKLQVKDIKAFTKAIDVLFEQFQHKINKPIETAFTEVYKDAKSDVKEVRDDVKEDDKVKNASMLILPINVKKKIKAFKKEVNSELNTLYKSTITNYKKTINNINNTIIHKKITSGDVLYNIINKAMQTGIKDMYVTYRNGRNVSFKAYMEMNVRTTMQQEALKYQFEASRDMGVVFYLCSYFSDCAKDHADYQGKIYYDEDWVRYVPKAEQEQVRNYIASNKLMSIQDVRDNKPYLTTRPNCRHTFRPITREQAMNNSTTKLLKDFGMAKGKYDAKNYVDLQKQRKYERDVRKFKELRDEAQIKIQNAPDQQTKDFWTDKEKLYSSKVRMFQRAVNNVVKNNSALKRDYRRENYKAIVQDVGYKYRNDTK